MKSMLRKFSSCWKTFCFQKAIYFLCMHYIRFFPFQFQKFFVVFWVQYLLIFRRQTSCVTSIHVSIQGFFEQINICYCGLYTVMYTVIVNGLFKSRNLILNEKMLSRVNKITKENFTIRDKCWNDLSVN